jgi:hypothetical protein
MSSDTSLNEGLFINFLLLSKLFSKSTTSSSLFVVSTFSFCNSSSFFLFSSSVARSFFIVSISFSSILIKINQCKIKKLTTEIKKNTHDWRPKLQDQVIPCQIRLFQ